MKMSTTALAKKHGVTTQTIRRWLKEGKLGEYEKTSGGHFRVKIKEGRKIAYARVSSKKQESSLELQKEMLEKEKPEEIISEIASAFNFQRKGLQKILELAMSGTPIELVVTTQDRLARSGFKLIKWIIELHGGKIVSLEESAETEEFDTKELIGFITSFCNSHYGKRSANSRKKDKDIPKK